MAGSFLAVGAMGAAFTPMALASTSGTGTASVTLTSSGLSVSSVGNSSMNGAIGVAGTGVLGTADWADATGTGNGWNGTVAITPLTYTGTWATQSGTDALASTSAGTYNGTADGVYFKVTVTSFTSGSSVAFNYSSNYTGDTSGTGTATSNGTVLQGSVGKEGITIQFSSSGPYVSGDAYTVQAGAQTNTMAFSLAGSPTVGSVGTASVAPLYVATSNGQAITGTGLKFLSAALLTGMSGSSGYYTAAPGITFTPDSNSWAATYSGTVTYTIASGP